MKLEIEIREEDWQYACDKSNAQAEQIHAGQQAAKPEKEREPFSPLSVEEYAKEMIAVVEASYRQQRENEFLQQELSNPEVRARAIALLSDPAKREKAIELADAE
jgi:hypothetical protein